MQIEERHIAFKKKVGKIGDSPVFELATTGGLHLIVGTRGGKFETLGTGPHRAVARHIARKHAPEIQWSELSKADHVEEAHFAHLLPRYEELTDQMRKLQG